MLSPNRNPKPKPRPKPKPKANPTSAVTVTLCMIVKNEAQNLDRCLSSVQGIPGVSCDVVVMDTGSTDGTVDLARRRGARVFHHAWQGDFALARNAALEQVSGDWVLHLDGDEELAPASRQKLAGVLAATTADALGVCVRSFNPSGDLTESHESDQVRLFRNRPAYRYEQRIHEQIGPSIARTGGIIGSSGLSITHYGYLSPEAQGGVDREQRNLPLLEQALNISPNDLHLRTKLGCAYFRQNRHQEAEGLLVRVVADFAFLGADIEFLQESLRVLAAIAIARGDYPRAWEWAEASLSFGGADQTHLDNLLAFAHASLGVGKCGLEAALRGQGVNIQGDTNPGHAGPWAPGAGLEALRQAHGLLLEVRDDPRLRPEMVVDVEGWLVGCRSLIQTSERLRNLGQNSPGQERSARTLRAILNAGDVMAALESNSDELDAGLLTLVRANAASARVDCRPELAALMDSLGDYIAAWLALPRDPHFSPDTGQSSASSPCGAGRLLT